MENFEQQSEYWKQQFESAMKLIEQQQVQLREHSEQIRLLEQSLFGGPTK
jgi:hypothetical protein